MILASKEATTVRSEMLINGELVQGGYFVFGKSPTSIFVECRTAACAGLNRPRWFPRLPMIILNLGQRPQRKLPAISQSFMRIGLT